MFVNFIFFYFEMIKRWNVQVQHISNAEKMKYNPLKAYSHSKPTFRPMQGCAAVRDCNYVDQFHDLVFWTLPLHPEGDGNAPESSFQLPLSNKTGKEKLWPLTQAFSSSPFSYMWIQTNGDKPKKATWYRCTAAQTARWWQMLTLDRRLNKIGHNWDGIIVWMLQCFMLNKFILPAGVFWSKCGPTWLATAARCQAQFLWKLISCNFLLEGCSILGFFSASSEVHSSAA